MARQRDDLGTRRHVRVDLYMPGFLIPAPDAPWIECTIVDVSNNGVSVEVGSLPVPRLFGLSFTTGGEVLRICLLNWRQGEFVGARFVSARELRQGLWLNDSPYPQQQAPADYADRYAGRQSRKVAAARR